MRRRIHWEEFEEVLNKISKIDLNNITNKDGAKPDRVEIWLSMNSLYGEGWWLENSYHDPVTFSDWFISGLKEIGCLGENGEILDKFNHISRAEFCLYFYNKDKGIGILPMGQIEPREL